MTVSEKAKAFLSTSFSMSDDSGEAREIIRALLKENAAWQRSHARKATAGAKLNVKHHVTVKTLQDSLFEYERALRAIAENGMDAGHCKDFAMAVLAKVGAAQQVGKTEDMAQLAFGQGK